MAEEAKNRLELRNRELRDRYEQVVPPSEEVDGLTPLHTYKMKKFGGRPFEFVPVVLVFPVTGFLLYMFLGGYMRPVLGWFGSVLAGVIAIGLAWKLIRRLFHGDWVVSKEPFQREELKNAIANTVVAGPVVAPEQRYEFLVSGEEAEWESYVQKG